MKRALHGIATACVFILGNFMVIVLLPTICRVLGYSPERGLVWGGRPIFAVMLWATGFLLVCVITVIVGRSAGRRRETTEADSRTTDSTVPSDGAPSDVQ